MVNESKMFYWEMFGYMRKKERILREGEEKTNLRGRLSVEMYCKCKK